MKRFGLWLIFTGLALGVIFLSAGCQNLVSEYKYKGNTLDPPKPISDFELMAANGQPFRFSELEGDIALVFFGYTSCPDVCPLTLAAVRSVLDDLRAGRERVRVIFISTDPERDTPEVLSKYLAAFDLEFIGLTDDFAKVQAVMKPFGAFAEKDKATGSQADYLVSHTALLYLVDLKKREIVSFYPFKFEPEDLKMDLTHLLRKYS